MEKVIIELSQGEALVLLDFLDESQMKKRYTRIADYGIMDRVIAQIHKQSILLINNTEYVPRLEEARKKIEERYKNYDPSFFNKSPRFNSVITLIKRMINKTK